MFKAAAGAVYRRVKVAPSGGVATPSLSVGPTWNDNLDGTGTWSGTTDIATYAGFDYGVAPGVYTASAFDYSTYPTLELGTVHVIQLPDVGAGGILAAGTYYGRWWAGTDAGFTGYISTEQTFVVAAITGVGLEASTDFIAQESGVSNVVLVESGSSADISAFAAASALGGTEVIAGVQGGNNRKISATQLSTYVNS